MGLTRDDEKAYWGQISEVGKGSDDEESNKQDGPSSEEGEARSVEVNGSVLDGWGLEPTTVAWFTMIEKTDFMEDDEEDIDDDDDFGSDGGGSGNYFMDSSSADDDGDGDIFSSPDAFQ